MIEYYYGTNGPTINVENAQEVFDAIDILHTQVMDKMLPEDILRILEDAMDKLSELL